MLVSFLSLSTQFCRCHLPSVGQEWFLQLGLEEVVGVQGEEGQEEWENGRLEKAVISALSCLLGGPFEEYYEGLNLASMAWSDLFCLRKKRLYCGFETNSGQHCPALPVCTCVMDDLLKKPCFQLLYNGMTAPSRLVFHKLCSEQCPSHSGWKHGCY